LHDKTVVFDLLREAGFQEQFAWITRIVVNGSQPKFIEYFD
jgi:hypothetical protein